jgi:hypothetical protein
MLPNVQTTTDASGGAKNTNPVVLDYFISPFSISLSVRVTGTVNYTVQYTFDVIDLNSWVPSTANWVNHPSLTTQTATLDSNLAYPATAVRMVQNSGSGSCVFTVIQAGFGA